MKRILLPCLLLLLAALAGCGGDSKAAPPQVSVVVSPGTANVIAPGFVATRMTDSTPRGQQVPHAVSHHDGIVNIDAQLFRRRQEQIGIRLGRVRRR